MTNDNGEIYFRPDKPNADGGAYFSVANPDANLVIPPEPTDITTLMTAISQAKYDKPASMQLQEQNLQEAKDLLKQKGEFQVRLDIAAQQAQDHMGAIAQIRDNLSKNAPNMVDPSVQKQVDDIYQKIASKRIEDEAQTAMEYATVAKVHDLLATDPTEAKVLWDLYDKGDALKIHTDAMAKNLIMQQRIQELQQQYQNQSWPGYIYDLVTSVVPTNFNFSRAGILKDAGFKDAPGGLINWLLSGTNLQRQGEYLWNLPTDEFARAMAKDGPVMKAIHSNAGYFTGDPGTSSEILKSFNTLNTSDRNWANVWGVVDPAFLPLPWSKMLGVPGTLVRMGARKAGTAALAQTYDTILKEGAEAAAKKYGVTAPQVSEELERGMASANPSKFDVSLSTDVATHLEAAEKVIADLPDLVQVSRFNSVEELTTAIDSRLEDIAKQIGRPVKEMQVNFKNVRTGETTPFKGELPEQGNHTVQIEFVVGKRQGGGFASEKTAKGAIKDNALGDAEVFRDVSGQWFIRATKDMPEMGFYINPLKTPEHSMLGWFRSSARNVDRTMQQKAVAAGANAEKVAHELREMVKKGVSGLNRKEKDSLDSILRFGQNKEKWFSREEFDIMYQRQHGNGNTDKAWNAYSTYRLANDVDWVLRNDELYKARVIQGYERAKFKIGGVDYDLHAKVSYDPQVKPKERLYDASTGWHYGADDMSTEKLKQMIDDGYVLITPATDQIPKFADGRVLPKILIKKADLELSPIQKKVLAYSEGGHRAYKGTHFAKQVARGSMPDTGQEYLLNPNVFITGNKNQVGAWAKTMNEALDMWKNGERDAVAFDELFARAEHPSGFPSGEEFLKHIDEGKIGKDPIEVVRDREMPTDYYKFRDDVGKFFDPEESAATGYHRTTGQMYYSRKGEALKDWTGDFAETIDPWDSLNTALYNITRNQSLSNYKVTALERFKNNFAEFLELKNLETGSPYEVIKAPVRKGVPSEIAEKIEAERNHITQVLRFKTEFEQKVDRATQRVAEWVLGDSTDGARERAHDFVYWVRKNDPVRAARGLAFDAKLGMFNPRQLFVQTQTMLAATALNPKYGFKGMFGAAPMFHYVITKGSENVLDMYAKRGVWKWMGFSGEEEFKDFARFVHRSGFLDVGNTHLLINEWGPNRVWGAASKLDAIREYGRIMFYSAEQLNRATSARIAWGEALDAGLKPGTAQFRERFIGLADDYSMNMTNESAAQMQRGVWSIPTQFWAYNMRMMDAMFGKRFTAAQRRRLIATQFGLYGSAAVPAASVIMDYMKERNIIPEDQQNIDSIVGTLNRGVMDRAFYEMFNADVVAGQQLGAGTFIDGIVRDIFGRGEFGEKSAAEIAGGATGSIAWTLAQDVGNMGGVLKSILLQSDAEAGDAGIPMLKDSVIQLAKEVSTFNNASKAQMIYRSGLYFSKKGSLLADNIRAEDAFFAALGFNPAEIEDLRIKSNWKENRDDIVDDFSKQIIIYRTESAFNPDKRLDNARKTEMMMNMAPEELRPDIIKKANRNMPDSYYNVIRQKYMEEQVEDQLVERYNDR